MNARFKTEDCKQNDLLIRHTRVLKALNRLGSIDGQWLSHNEFMIRCGEILLKHSDFKSLWVCRHTIKETELSSLGLLYLAHKEGGKKTICCRDVQLKFLPADLLNNVLETRASSISTDFRPPPEIKDLPLLETPKSCGVWPLICRDHFYGVFLIYSSMADGFNSGEITFLDNAISDMALKIYSHDVTAQLQLERDFNTEIIDTIQALMVSITPCGKIVRFNLEAEKITGYKETEVTDSYWVDILLSPDNRLAYQKLVSDLLSKNIGNINFRAELETKQGAIRTIEWHSSIKHDIDEGTVGMVLFGLDITEQLLTDKAYNSAIARFENIFSTIQDPAIITTREGLILDANHATFTASRKSREQVIGQSVCRILHGTTSRSHKCHP